ncbi:MAG: hypothetical protein RJA70_3765 [Pseudomonadota bacterium]
MSKYFRNFSRPAAICAALGLAFSATSCSSPAETEDDTIVGEVEFALNLGHEIDLASVHYDVSGNGYSRSGDVNVQKSRVLRFQLGGLPVGEGFVITLSALGAKDPEITCSGSSTFDIQRGQLTRTSVTLTCRLPRRSGSLLVNGQVNVCPQIEELSVLPADTVVGSTVSLLASASDPDEQPAALTYVWAASGGQVTDLGNDGSTWSCEQPGTHSVSLTVSDGDCEDTVVTSVTCSSPDEDPEPEPVRLVWNEVESNGGLPDDWAELYNAGTQAVDLSGWIFKDNDDTHVYPLPAGTQIAPNQYLVLDGFGFGLGSSDSARLFDPSLTLVAEYSWVGHASTTYGRCPNPEGDWTVTTSSTKGTANDCFVPTPRVVLNEVESSGGLPGDWVELLNTGNSTADLSGWVFKDNDDTHAYMLPGGTLLAAGAYLVLDESVFGFGLGGADSARLFNRNGELVDSLAYPAHAATTYGRCADGSGEFKTTTAPSKSVPNLCPADPNLAVQWPGAIEVLPVDPQNAFPTNLSGLTYQPATASQPGVLWGALNGPSKIYKLVWNGSEWAPEAGEWATGKFINYPTGTGQPDTEGITKAEWTDPAIYVSTERNNEASSTSRLSVLRLDVSALGGTLTASHEWNLNAQLPVVGANAGLEAISWLPDTDLVARGFYDEFRAQPYNPAQYPGHGTGLFVVGVEGTGNLHLLALDHLTNTATIVATLSSGHVSIMGLEYDRDTHSLWAICDDTCGNQTTVLSIDTNPLSPTRGRLVVKARYNAPAGLPNSNNEGFALQPEAECVGGAKQTFWSDDANFGMHALRQGTIPCGLTFP